ncbi:MAG: tRNA 2-selenouridine(34) synthase MnmH [Burkholderiales bacterium]|nr:tRNA 2-selenouridine(34) synthase MnmH [Burkholderiales bacterium]
MSARPSRTVGVDALASHPDRLDVRSPSEFADDHVPGAISCPVLDDDERALVGTLHAEQGAFEAKKAGAALVSRHIAAILETVARDKPRDWAPLVYCWRGGKRSGSLAHVLNEIGFPAVQLEGGYRTWRRHVVARLATLPAAFRYRVVCGVTGSGKSRLLAALDAEGAQVLDLEGLAQHRGSLLGDVPGAPQPSQKAFETAIHETYTHFDARLVVWIESESRKIGALQVPDALLERMRAAPCVRVELPPASRIALLKEEYAHFLADPGALAARLAHLTELRGQATIERWSELAHAGDFDALVAELLESHYDPTYLRAMTRNYAGFDAAPRVSPAGIAMPAWRALARELIAGVDT